VPGIPVVEEVLGDLFGQLPRDQFLADDVPDSAEPRKPGSRGSADRRLPLLGQSASMGERLDQGFCPRLTWGFGSRSRRI
jgi:hypothetical protein